MTEYGLEVQQWDDESWRTNPLAGKFKHVGYMQVRFSSPIAANAYYVYRNPGMRPITAYDGVHSDWDPDTELRYVIRELRGEQMNVEPFHPDDKPTVSGHNVTFPPLPGCDNAEESGDDDSEESASEERQSHDALISSDNRMHWQMRVYYTIVARLHSDAPRPFPSKWARLLEKAPNMHSSLSRLLAKGTNLPLLSRAEGGVGGNSNLEDKQLRFERDYERAPCCQFQELRANLENPDSRDAVAWSLTEAFKMREIFQQCCETELGAEYVDCHLVIRHEFSSAERTSCDQPTSYESTGRKRCFSEV
eukprot:TRINITY_DN13907_c0_g1_i1.p1 TRINITY_DN13907_c0_g1~~TRINITY_DN13907_c0_g1_i1.p1  ORF type:complete len:306 (-),score=16.02 TRINITY_DN13907_c0_g1_i1:78-995(-)